MAFGLFKKKKQEKKEDNRYLTLKIKEVVNVASEAVNLVFEKPDKPFNYKPGQFITIISEVGGKKLRRAYSLCTTPFEDEYPAVTVKRVPGGLMSNAINDHFKAGDEVEVMEPMGMFTTEFDASNSRDAIFFGGGSGVTPLYSLLRSVLIKEPNSKVSLVYGNRSEKYVVFNDRLSALVEKYPERFRLIHILEDDPSNITSFKGRPTPDMIVSILDQLQVTPESEIYICGPEPMMNIVTEGLKLAKVEDSQVRMESFEIGKTSPSDITEEEKSSAFDGNSEVTIIMDGEEHVIQVPKGETILDAGLDSDLDMPYSCQSGLCTACRGKCLEGEISLDNAEGISQDEIEEGYRLLCVGKALSPKIKIEVG